MNGKPLLWRIALVIGFLAGPMAARGQDSSRRYVPIPYQGDLEAMLRGQLSRDKLEELVKKLRRDLEKIKIEPKSLPLIKPEKQQMKVKELLKTIPVEQLSPEQKKVIKKFLTETPALKAMPPKIVEKLLAPIDAAPPPPPEENLESRLGRWVHDLMKDAENSNI